jgi:hypothetical protein
MEALWLLHPMKTRVCQILGQCLASMFLGNDVIKLEIQEISGFGHPTIFASSLGPRADDPLQILIHPNGSPDPCRLV